MAGSLRGVNAMSKPTRAPGATTALLVGLLALVCVLASPPAVAAQDDTLRIGDEHGLFTLDPHEATSTMEMHVAEACFEGLCRIDERTLEPAPGLAASWTTSEDRLRWTFRLREGLTWSDGTALTAGDIARGLRRALDPATGSAFASALHAIDGAAAWNANGVAVLRLAGPRGLIEALRRWVARHPAGADAETWVRWVGQGELPPMLERSPNALVRAAVRGDRGRWSPQDLAALVQGLEAALVSLRATHVEAAATFGRSRGVVATDARTLRIDLERPVPNLPELLAMPVAAPVPPSAHVTHETKGAAAARRAATRWWRAASVPVCGPFRVVERVTQRGEDGFGVILERNPSYHDAAAVAQRRIEVAVVPDPKDSLRRFTEGTLDWATTWPREVTPQLARTPLMRTTDANISYFFVLRTRHPALRDVRVRRALAKAVDRKALLATLPAVLARPATTLVPATLPGYRAPDAGLAFDPEAARALLAAAVPKGGASLPPIDLVYNVGGAHREIAAFAAAQWQQHLGVRVRPVGTTWFQYSVRKRIGDFGIARAGWIGDHADPLGFLALFESSRGANEAQWADSTFDALLAGARAEVDPLKRMAALSEAEAHLFEVGVPCVPIFWYRRGDLVHPWVKGFRTHAVGAAPGEPGAANVQGLHPFRGLSKER